MGEEDKLMEAYKFAENLCFVTEKLLAKVESENKHGVLIDHKSLALIYHYIFKIQALLRDMNIAMVSSGDSIPDRKLWQSRESLVYGDVSSLYLRLQKLLDHPNPNPNPNPKVESNFDHPGCSSFIGVNSSHCIIDMMEKGIEASTLSDATSHRIRGEQLCQSKQKKQRAARNGKESLPGYTWWDKALQESRRPSTWSEIALSLLMLIVFFGVIFCRILGM